jgi:hypothetical protein
LSQIVAADSGPSISGSGIGFVAGRRITFGFLCAERPLFWAGPDADGVEAELFCDDEPDGAVELGGVVSEVESFSARVGAEAGAGASVGAVARPGVAVEALSTDDSARAGVASSAVVVVSAGVVSVAVVSVVVASAAADVASSAAFMAANLSPATAVNVAPAKKRAA